MTKKKVALFQRVGDSDWTPVFYANVSDSDDEADESQPDGYVRISPYVEVAFQPLPHGPVIEKQLEQLAKAEQKAREELQERLNRINDTRQRLLALAAPVAA